MKKLFLILSVSTLGYFTANGQNVPSKSNPDQPPSKIEKDQDPTNLKDNDVEFPPEIDQTTVTDTADILNNKVDTSGRMINKDSIDKNKQREKEKSKK